MRRRHRRVLFNVFAFSLLAIAVYLNMFRMNDKTAFSYAKQNRVIIKETVKNGRSLKTTAKEN
jgi:cbb3-type cytochrome oxidase subunit 3